jgi:shikimate kinase
MDSVTYHSCVFIVLNGPLGIGKSTLGDALAESLDRCVMLDGDRLIAANPPAVDEREHLHSTIAVLVAHHRRFGYRHFVIDYVWRDPEHLDELRRRLAAIDPDAEFQCFLLTLSEAENLRRIEARQKARAIDERDFELRTVLEEREALARTPGLGEPFDVSAAPTELVARMRRHLGLARIAPRPE